MVNQSSGMKLSLCRMMLTLALAAFAYLACAGEMYYLQPGYSNNRGDKAGQTYTLINPVAWATTFTGGDHPTAIQAGDFYVVANNKLLCLPAKSAASDSLTFPAKMTIGEVGGTIGYLLNYMYTSAVIDWAGGIELANGDYLEQTWTRSGNTQGDLQVSGDITVTSPVDVPFHISLGYGNVQFSFNGSLLGNSGTGLLLGAKPRQGSNGIVSRQTVRFLGNTTGYLGDMIVTSRYETITSSDWGMSLAGRATLSGTTTVSKGCMVHAVSSSDTLTLGSLVLRDGAGIGVNISVAASAGGYPTAYACGLVKATNSFVMDGRAVVRVADDIVMSSATNLPVLTVPYASALDKNDFDVVGLNGPSLDVVEDAVAGTKSLVLKLPSYVYLTVSDVDSTMQNTADSSITNAAHWSDGDVPHSGANYRVRRLASGQTTALATQGGHKAYGNHSFGGDSLTMESGTKLYGFAENFSIKKLTLMDGSGLSLGQATHTRFYGNELCVPDGVATLYAYCATASYYHMRIDMPLTGVGTLKMVGVNNTGSPHGIYRFMKQSPDFMGRFVVSQVQQSSAPKWAEGYQEMWVSDALQLGGNLPALDLKAVTLENYGMIRAKGSFTVATSQNRGIFVGESVYGGRIAVESDGSGNPYEMALNTCLTMNGRLYKEGTGTLTLGGMVKFGETGQDAPIALSNRLDVLAGTLKVTSATAVDGLVIALSNGTQIVLSPNLSDAALTASGIKNVKTDTPFVLPAGVSTLPLVVDWSRLTREHIAENVGRERFRVVVLTVSNGAAADIRGMFTSESVAHNLSGFKCSPIEYEEGGNYKFALDFRPRNLVVSFK